MTINWKKIKLEIFFSFKNCNLLILGLHKGVQATGEAFSPQKRTSSTSKDEIYCFLFFWVIFALLDPIHNTGGIQCGMCR
jgi:hypothetical protein